MPKASNSKPCRSHAKPTPSQADANPNRSHVKQCWADAWPKPRQADAKQSQAKPTPRQAEPPTNPNSLSVHMALGNRTACRQPLTTPARRAFAAASSMRRCCAAAARQARRGCSEYGGCVVAALPPANPTTIHSHMGLSNRTAYHQFITSPARRTFVAASSLRRCCAAAARQARRGCSEYGGCVVAALPPATPNAIRSHMELSNRTACRKPLTAPARRTPVAASSLRRGCATSAARLQRKWWLRRSCAAPNKP